MSPKGKFRLCGTLVVGIFFYILIMLSNAVDPVTGQFHVDQLFNPSGWVFKQLNNIGEMCIGLFVLYLAHRRINHIRTHELINKYGKFDDRVIHLTLVWIIAIAYVVGNALH